MRPALALPAVLVFAACLVGDGYDCEPLYYRFGHSPTTARESYVVVLAYGFGSVPLP